MSNANVEIESKPRRRGRPTSAEKTKVTKREVIAQGLVLARSVGLQDITITSLARDLAVTPQLIHYLIPGRDGLITGVMNAFYRELCEEWPKDEPRWRDHMIAMAHHLHAFYLRYRGVVLYTAAHNRYRLVQSVDEGETDYGLVFLDLLFRGAMKMSLDAATTVVFCEIFIDFVSSQARAAIGTRLPRAHQGYLRGVFEQLDPAKFPGIAFAGESLFAPDNDELFEQGLSMLMDSFEMRRAKLI